MATKIKLTQHKAFKIHFSGQELEKKGLPLRPAPAILITNPGSGKAIEAPKLPIQPQTPKK